MSARSMNATSATNQPGQQIECTNRLCDVGRRQHQRVLVVLQSINLGQERVDDLRELRNPEKRTLL